MQANSDLGGETLAGHDELVLAIRRTDLFYGDAFDGVKCDGLELIRERIRRHHFWIRRAEAERDESVKQLIPYCVIRRADRVFLTRRLGAQTEARLHNLYSVGIGGHMNENGAATLEDLVARNLRRELAEELIMDEPEAIELIGALNDDSTSVSRCHFGLLYQVWTRGDVKVRETDKMIGEFVPLIDIGPGSEIYREMEDWSRHAVSVLRRKDAEGAD